MNPIQRALQARIQALLASSAEVGAVGHDATVGQLREQLLIDFFTGLVPQSLSCTSGIICDARGNVSRQTDFIVKNDYALPALSMSTTVAIVPVESVHLTAEIKSTLKTDHLTKLASDRDVFNQLQLATFPVAPVGVDIKIPSVMLAFDSVVARSTLEQWMSETPDVVAICVIGDFSMAKSQVGIQTFEAVGGTEYYETLRFAEQLFGFLADSVTTSRGRPLWSAYLRGVDDLHPGAG